MNGDALTRLLLIVPVSLSGLILSNECSWAGIVDSKMPRLLAQANDASGNMQETIRGVVEMTLRKKWQPVAGAEGKYAVVQFVIGNSGQLQGDPSLRESQGQKAFDDACLDAVSKIGPLPKLPEYMSSLPLSATFHSGKSPWVELKLNDGSASSSSSSGSGQSDWVKPQASSPPATTGGTGESEWVPPASSLGQSDWQQPAGSAPVQSQSGWTQPQASQQTNPNTETPAMPAQDPGWQPNPTQPPANQSSFPPQNLPPKNTQSPAPTKVQAQSQSQVKAAKPATQTPKKTANAQTQKPANGNGPNNQLQMQQAQMQPQGENQPTGMSGMTDMSGSQDLTQRVILLNNNAVVAINDNNYEGAIKKLEEALKIDPTYKQARENLAIAYNNYGLQLKNRPDEAIKIFHKAFALDPTNQKTRINLDTIIQYMGKSPNQFKDRLELGNRACAHGDMLGARIEYEAALAIKQDPIVQQKLEAVIAGRVPPPATQTHAQPPKAAQTKPPAATQKPGPAAQQPVREVDADNTTDSASPSGVSQKVDTMYRNLKNLEMKTFGKTFESDDVLSRLSRLEQKLLGKTQAGKPMRRLDSLLML